MKRNILLNSISVLLILLFVYTGVSKLIGYYDFIWVLTKSPITRNFPVSLALFIPMSELVAAALLLSGTFLRKWGFYTSTLLMLIFTSYICYMLLFIPHNHLPCSCGGVLRVMTWKQHLIFNIFFLFLAMIGSILSNREPQNPIKTSPNLMQPKIA